MRKLIMWNISAPDGFEGKQNWDLPFHDATLNIKIFLIRKLMVKNLYSNFFSKRINILLPI